jgi:hypothetical protein
VAVVGYRRSGAELGADNMVVADRKVVVDNIVLEVDLEEENSTWEEEGCILCSGPL